MTFFLLLSLIIWQSYPIGDSLVFNSMEKKNFFFMRAQSPLNMFHIPPLILDLKDLFRPFIGFKEIRVVHKEPRRVSLLINLFLFI